MGKSTAYEFFMPKATLVHMNKSTEYLALRTLAAYATAAYATKATAA